MKHIPNILSVFRIVLIPFFVWQMQEGQTLTAAVILIVSGLTDFLDGFLARRFHWVSNVGKVLDPLSDKLTQVTVCILLIIQLRDYWYFFAIMLFKELVMLALGSRLVKNRVKIDGARWFGKVVTILFYVIMVALLLFPNMPPQLVFALLLIVTASALIAGTLYIPEYLRYHRKLKENREATLPEGERS